MTRIFWCWDISFRHQSHVFVTLILSKAFESVLHLSVLIQIGDSRTERICDNKGETRCNCCLWKEARKLSPYAWRERHTGDVKNESTSSPHGDKNIASINNLVKAMTQKHANCVWLNRAQVNNSDSIGRNVRNCLVKTLTCGYRNSTNTSYQEFLEPTGDYKMLFCALQQNTSEISKRMPITYWNWQRTSTLLAVWVIVKNSSP